MWVPQNAVREWSCWVIHRWQVERGLTSICSYGKLSMRYLHEVPSVSYNWRRALVDTSQSQNLSQTVQFLLFLWSLSTSLPPKSSVFASRKMDFDRFCTIRKRVNVKRDRLIHNRIITQLHIGTNKAYKLFCVNNSCDHCGR